MDVFFEQGLSRNGLDESYFDFLGLGKKKRERAADAAEESQLQELESKFPDVDSIEKQNNNLVLLKKGRNKVQEERSKAKSKKNRTTLDSRLRAYDRYIRDYEYRLEVMKIGGDATPSVKEIPSLGTLQREIIVTPAPIVTSKDGEIELPKKQVFVEETSQDAIETQVSPLLAKEDGILPTTQSRVAPSPTTSKKDNNLLYVGIGIAALLGILLIRKNN
jgi:hypothetical protein